MRYEPFIRPMAGNFDPEVQCDQPLLHPTKDVDYHCARPIGHYGFCASLSHQRRRVYVWKLVPPSQRRLRGYR